MSAESVFISYSHTDSEVVVPIVRALQQSDIACWIDRDRIQSGDSFVGALDEALGTARAFILFLSTSYVQSRWTQKELRVAVQFALSAESRKLFVVRLDDAAMPPLLTDILYTKHYSAAQTAAEIAARLGSVPPAAATELDWTHISDHVIYTLAGKVIELSGQAGPKTLDIDAGNGSKYRLALVPFLLSNEMLVEDLRLELEICRTLQKLIGHLRRQIVEGGLGVFAGAFELNMERKQQELTKSRTVIRNQLREIAPRILQI